MIAGVRLRALVRHADDRGSFTELLRSDWPEFAGFAQASLTMNYPGVIRGWHWHRRQTDCLAVLAGMAKVPLFDARKESPTAGEISEFFLGDSNLALLVIPPGVYHGYKTIGVEPAMILNLPDRIYDAAQPDEERVPFDSPDVPYSWGLRPR